MSGQNDGQSSRVVDQVSGQTDEQAGHDRVCRIGVLPRWVPPNPTRILHVTARSRADTLSKDPNESDRTLLNAVVTVMKKSAALVLWIWSTCFAARIYSADLTKD